MVRKSKRQSRGRPPGSRQYPGDDRLCLRMALLIRTGQAKGVPAAATQMEAEEPDGLVKQPGSQTTRLKRHYRNHERQFLEEADRLLEAERLFKEQVRALCFGHTDGRLGSFVSSFDVAADFARMVGESPLAEARRRIDEGLRHITNERLDAQRRMEELRRMAAASTPQAEDVILRFNVRRNAN